MVLMIVVFNLGQSEKKVDDFTATAEMFETEVIEVTIQEESSPAPPQPRQALSVITDVIQIVDNETQITEEMVFAEFDETAQFTGNVISTVETGRGSDGDQIFLAAEQMPKFQGGELANFRKWVMERVKYPQLAKEMNISGTVVLSFVVEKDGSLTNIEVISNPDRLLAEEAIRVVKQSPKWEPGRQQSIPVRVKFNLPIQFVIQ